MRTQRVVAFFFWFASLVLASGAAWSEDRSSHYLADGRVHVAVVPDQHAPVGQVWWNDTVSGASGGARFCREGARLVVEWSPGVTAEARLVPDVAIVFSLPPWGFQPTSLGLALD